MEFKEGDWVSFPEFEHTGERRGTIAKIYLGRVREVTKDEILIYTGDGTIHYLSNDIGLVHPLGTQEYVVFFSGDIENGGFGIQLKSVNDE